MQREFVTPTKTVRHEGVEDVRLTGVDEMASWFTVALLTIGLWALALIAFEKEAIPATVPKEEHHRVLSPVYDFIETELAARLPAEHKQDASMLAQVIGEAAERHHFSPALLLAVIQTESSFHYKARSNHGAMGLMQIKPATAKEMAKRYRLPYRGPADLENPIVNIRLGAAYLSHLKGRFNSTKEFLAAYNVGPRGLKQGGRLAGIRYAKKVHGRRLAFLAAGI